MQGRASTARPIHSRRLAAGAFSAVVGRGGHGSPFIPGASGSIAQTAQGLSRASVHDAEERAGPLAQTGAQAAQIAAQAPDLHDRQRVPQHILAGDDPAWRSPPTRALVIAAAAPAVATSLDTLRSALPARASSPAPRRGSTAAVSPSIRREKGLTMMKFVTGTRGWKKWLRRSTPQGPRTWITRRSSPISSARAE